MSSRTYTPSENFSRITDEINVSQYRAIQLLRMSAGKGNTIENV